MTRGLREKVQLAVIAVLVLLALGGLLATFGSNDSDTQNRNIPTQVLEVSNPTRPGPAVSDRDAGTKAPDMLAPKAAGRCDGSMPFRGTSRIVAPNGVGTIVHLPTGYDGSTPRPTVVIFHRAFDDPARMVAKEVVATSEINDFVVLALESEQPTGWSKEEYVTSAETILWAHEEFCLDRSRLFIVGNDQGAKIVANLACMMPVSGTVATFDRSVRGCQPVVPTSRMRIYGLRDKNVPVEGGMSCSIIEGGASSAAEIRENWIELMQCGGRTDPWGDYPSGECERRNCREDAVYMECALDSGHYWPHDPGPMIPTKACDTKAPDVAFPMMTVIWDFFSEHGYVMAPDELAKYAESGLE